MSVIRASEAEGEGLESFPRSSPKWPRPEALALCELR